MIETGHLKACIGSKVVVVFSEEEGQVKTEMGILSQVSKNCIVVQTPTDNYTTISTKIIHKVKIKNGLGGGID